MSIDNRSLIRQVEARPALWNRNDFDYGLKQVSAKLWAEIAASLGVHESIAKNKWKALRDTFRQELKKSSQPTNWSLYPDMSFLKDHMKTGLSKKKKSEADDDVGGAPVKAEPQDVPPFALEDPEGSSFLEGDLDPDAPPGPDTNDDYHFLMSFLPEMRKLPPKKKMLLRIKMMELFYDEIYRHESE